MKDYFGNLYNTDAVSGGCSPHGGIQRGNDNGGEQAKVTAVEMRVGKLRN